jgi:hypothetical protein
MTLKLPSRYEDLDQAFRGRLKPVPELIDLIQAARRSMAISGGLRFLPLFGESGSGKSSAARELDSHLPETKVLELPRPAIGSFEALKAFLSESQTVHADREALIVVVDQYEEAVAAQGNIPTQFVEWLSLLDRDAKFSSSRWIFLWLTTSKEFQSLLEAATSRNRRILAASSFELRGPSKAEWSGIVEETFEFHNSGRPLADYAILQRDVEQHALTARTLGATIERVGEALGEKLPLLQDLSTYQIVMLWPVTDGQRINTILRFVDAREGYRLDWNAWFRQLNEQDRAQLPLAEFNRARLYFDVRLVPMAAADLHPLCKDLDDDNFTLHKTYTERFDLTHYVSILRGTWDPARYSPLRERPSERASEARDWYSEVTTKPTKIGRRIAQALTAVGVTADHEQDVTSPHGTVRADVLSERTVGRQTRVITELKAYSPENTIPSTIRDAVRTTLRRHSQFGGFLQRQ